MLKRLGHLCLDEVIILTWKFDKPQMPSLSISNVRRLSPLQLKMEAQRRMLNEWPKDALEQVNCCPICKVGQRKLLYSDLEDWAFSCAPGKWAMYECYGCRCAYLDPRPNHESIGLAYAQYFTHSSGKSTSPPTWLSQLKQRAKNGYLNVRWDMHRAPVSMLLARMIRFLPTIYSRAIDQGYMRGLPMPANGRHVLDVGCGNGEFLSLAEEAGWRATGVDFDPQAVSFAKSLGLDVRQGGIEQAKDNSYDVITMSHVIEHVHDPEKMLIECQKLLKPDGYFWIETPNINSYGHMIFGKHWRGLEAPRHLMLFNVERLASLLQFAGFSRIRQATWRPSVKYVYQVSRAIQQGLPPGQQATFRSPRILGLIIEAVTAIQARRREFITLVASKD